MVMTNSRSRSSDPQSRAGLGFVGALTIAFVVLKLCGILTWSWWWVLAPIWISALAGFLIFALVVAGAVVYVLLDRDRRPARRDDSPPARVDLRDTSPHGPVRKWGPRPPGLPRTAPRSDAARLRDDTRRIWGDDQ